MSPPRRVGGTAEHCALKMRCPHGRVGSNPAPGTTVGGARQVRMRAHPVARAVVDSALRAVRRRRARRAERPAPWRSRQDASGAGVATTSDVASLAGSSHCAAECPRCDDGEPRPSRLRRAPGLVPRRRLHQPRSPRRLQPPHLQRRGSTSGTTGVSRTSCGRVKPGGRPHTRLVRRVRHHDGRAGSTGPACSRSTDRARSTSGRSCWRTGSAVPSRRIRPPSCAACSTPTAAGS